MEISKAIQLGSYPDQVSASLAYDKAAKQQFGKFARTNQMMNPYSQPELQDTA